MKNNHKSILICLLIIGTLIYAVRIQYIKKSKIGILNNTKYTVGKVTSKYDYYRYGYDYIFVFNDSRKDGHQDGDFIPGHKYLVAYDSTDVKNGFLILDRFDVTDSLEKHRIFGEYGLYWEGWSLQKIPFQYDKSDIQFEVKEIINKYR